MKRNGILLILLVVTLAINAQIDSLESYSEDSLEIAYDDIDTSDEDIVQGDIEEVKKDTTKLRVGRKSISIIQDGEETYIKVLDSKDDKEKDFDFEIEDDEMEFKKKRKKKDFEGHFAGIELGLNNYGNDLFTTALNPGDEFMELNTSKAINCNINAMQYSIPLFSSHLGLVTGLGFEFNNYRFDNNNSIQKDSLGIIEAKTFDPGVNLDYSRLTTTYLTCPLILEFQIPTSYKENKPIHIGAGVIGGLKIGSKTKYRISGNNEKTKLPGNYNLSPFRYGLTARIGYRALNLYANYYLSPLFEKKGPELYPFSIGLVIIPFN
ncbi:MAG: outer membrane beta-barrel protein [Bacteroidales bacterium]|nr:outer membrane beta-barrel protein [Bacteroidales bacterium]